MLDPDVDSEYEGLFGVRTSTQRLEGVSGQEWRYHVAGTGPHPLLVLSGSLGSSAVIAKLLSERLSATRVIVPEYAPVAAMDECLQALDRILNEERIDRIALYGGSFGGLIAQSWARRNPSRVTHLILSGTAPPDPSRVKKHSRAIRILPLVPLPVIRFLMRLLLRVLLHGIDEPRWRQEYLRLIASLTRKDLRSRYQLAIDFDRDDQLPALPASVNILILAGDRDRVATGNIRNKLRHAYPQARSHVFKGAGHSPMITHSREWSRVVNDFLQRLS